MVHFAVELHQPDIELVTFRRLLKTHLLSVTLANSEVRFNCHMNIILLLLLYSRHKYCVFRFAWKAWNSDVY